MDTVRIEKSGPVWTVILDRINARNSVDPATADALAAAFKDFGRDHNAHVAVLWGAGGAFCAGWDLKYAATLADSEKFKREVVDALAFADGPQASPRGPLGPTRLELTKPVIAAVEGPAVAGGMELALWCDIRILGEGGYFGVFCRRWGIPLLDGGTARLPRLVGVGRAMEIILSGRKVDAEESYRIGLCEKVVPAGQARFAAEMLAREIARFPHAAVKADRRSAYATQGLQIQDALRREWSNGVWAHNEEGAAGAARFASGMGRSGSFGWI